MSRDSEPMAKNQLLEAGEISDHKLQEAMGRLMSHQVDRGELFFQSNRSESWALEEGIVKDAGFSVSRGMGTRAISGEKSGFAYADDIHLQSLEQTTSAARAIAGQGGDSSTQLVVDRELPTFYEPLDPINSVSYEQKVSLLSRIDEYTRNLDPRVKEVTVQISASHETMFVYGSDGVSHGDVRPMVRFGVSVMAEQDGRREQGTSGGGGRHDLRWLFEDGNAESFAREAVRQALINLDAVDAPAGPMTVVLGPGWPGVLLHEAVGHGLEGDFNRKGTSAFSNRIGDRVASPLCTVVDDATLPNRRGSLSMDDEGTPGQRTVLIEDGVLRGYMQDKLNASLMGTTSTGNGRRESYAHQPMPRMTNTFMLAGDSDPEEIIQSVDQGIYAVSFGGGQVDITSGQFVFSATEAYLIENGKKTAPIRGATLIGNGPEVMTRVSMVGNDMKLDQGIGVCGKDGQGVPVGVGQPTLKVDEITVGGHVHMTQREQQEVSKRSTQHEAHTKQDEESLKNFVAQILEEAKKQGATAAEVSAGDDVGLSVQARSRDLETVEFSRDRGFGITVYLDHQKGSTSTTDISPESIEESVRAAVNIARHTEPDPHNGLADPDRLATVFPDLDLYHPRPMDFEEAKEIALEAESTALDWDTRIVNSNGARVHSTSSCGAYGNSLGFLQASRGSRYSVMADVIAKDDSGMQTDYWYSTSRKSNDLESPKNVGETAAKRTLMKLNPRPIPTGAYPVLFDAPIAGGLFSHLISALGGRAQYLKSSFLLDSLGKAVATDKLTLRECPHLDSGLGSRNYDSEGVATYEKCFVERGIVQSYCLSSYSGRHLNLPTTANASGVTNLLVESEIQGIEEIMQQMGTGLIVKSLMGQGVNLVTGDYSRGASGYWIENGEFAHAVDELTIAGKLQEMFMNMVAFGDDIDLRHNIRTGSVLVESMTVAAN